MAKEMSIYNYDQDGALIITHFAPDTVTAACGVYILDRRAAWTVEPGLVEGCPSCLQAAGQNAGQNAGQDAGQDADQDADQVDDNPSFCCCPGAVGGCPCYNLGFARGKEEAAGELAGRPSSLTTLK